MKAGASSMWASCCGLLNEVMGTGAVRGQQPGFGAGAGPFRFAPSAGYSTYPPTASGTQSLVCKACGQTFSVFRRKHVCRDCKKCFCSLCSLLQEGLRACATCSLLRATAFQRPRLMRLRVKDLRQYLLLRDIPTDTCREKEDLVDLVLCHRRSEGEDVHQHEADRAEPPHEDHPHTAGLRPRSPPAPPASVAPSASEPAALPAPPGEGPLGRGDSSDSNQGNGDATSVSLLNLDPTPSVPTHEVTPQARRRARASLSDLSGARDIESLSVRQLKEILSRNFVNYSGCCEKWELVERVSRLHRETEENRRSMDNLSAAVTAVVALPPPPPICNGVLGDVDKARLSSQDDHLCRICMDAVIDCVLLECGHMVTCTKCGKRMSECPICRQYVVRAVHVFKS
ncbi:E3 ubiquitin-protein ligase RNF34a isoform X2 [Gadus morhua]|uniref:RING-type E3 ubiquitin transferase n=1 Tax=Gadus morhua TaxID=8049 RepID=A0A8C5CE28_GADMO|nr:E3 ubiquitin-protein ligase RNF34 isoform X2 [Gadus morhua]